MGPQESSKFLFPQTCDFCLPPEALEPPPHLPAASLTEGMFYVEGSAFTTSGNDRVRLNYETEP